MSLNVTQGRREKLKCSIIEKNRVLLDPPNLQLKSIEIDYLLQFLKSRSITKLDRHPVFAISVLTRDKLSLARIQLIYR